MDRQTRGWARERRGRQPSPGSAAARLTACGLGEGFAVGSAVFAPRRRRAGALHYALAEVTGVQACAGTATVAFVNAEPGVDDGAVPLYALVPCPRPDFARGGVRCSFAERALRAAVRCEPTLSDTARGQQLSCDSDCGSEVGDGSPLSDTAAPPMPPQTPSSSPPSSSGEPGCEGEQGTIRVTHAPPESMGAFFARAFRAVCRAILRHPAGWQPAAQEHVVLRVFDTYDALRRFNVYMAFRGHRLHLIDGVCARAAPAAAGDVNWLCLLAEDVRDERAVLGLLGGWLSPGRRGEGSGVLTVASAVWFAEDCGDADRDGRNAEGLSRDGGVDAAVGRILVAVGGAGARITCRLSRGTKDDELMATSLAATCRHRAPPAWPPPRQNLGTAGPFRRRDPPMELRIPASTWQVDLFRLLVARGGAGEPPPSAAPLPPQLLQSIAFGNVFDASLSTALASLPGGPQQLDGIRERVVRSGAFFGDDAFPAFAAARAVLADVLTAPLAEHTSRRRRVVLVLPGAGSASDDAAAYLHAVQRFLHPWHLFTLASEKGQRQPCVAALLNSRAWLESGGVLLLNPEEPLGRLSLLQEEADVVVTCGKASAALVAGCGRGVPHITLHSEVELAEGAAHRWTLWRGAAGEADATDAERAVLAAAVAAGGEGAPPVLATAAALLHGLGLPMEGKGEAAEVVGGAAATEQAGRQRWAHLRRLAVAIALAAAVRRC
ncbi:trans-sialidase, putative, partial [Trypanosoma cruzi marinkellei]